MEDSSGQCDLKFTNAEIVDGSGGPRFYGDVAIDSGFISHVGDLTQLKAQEVVDVAGKILAPGFIDVHTHDDLAVLKNPGMDCKVSQGVTTVVGGNCGISIAPLSKSDEMPAPFPILGQPDEFKYPDVGSYTDAFNRAGPAVNLALLVGHSSLRLGAMTGSLDRAATADEISLMAKILQSALNDGCIGLSSGLDYPPAEEAPESEMVTLASELKSHPAAVYTTHMRDEGDGVLDAVAETLRTGRKADVPVIISHHKCAGPKNFGRSVDTLKLIETARKKQLVGLDVYPYTASSSSLIPRFIDGAGEIIVTFSEPHPEQALRTLQDIARDWQCSLVEAAERLYPAGAIYFEMDEADICRILAYPGTMVGSDGLPGMPNPHPRLWGTFPRILSRYVREQGVLSLEKAVHKMTGLSAATFNLKNRGLIRKGYRADLVIFDPDTIEDTATYEDPVQPARGICQVYVNGTATWANGEATGNRAGEFLKRG